MAKFKKGNLFQQLGRELKNSSIGKIIQNFTQKPTRTKFDDLKKEMLVEFRKLPVIEALEYGPGFGSNDFAGILGGKGDLFSFLGFKRRVKPANKLITEIRKMSVERGKVLGFDAYWVIRNFPTVETFAEATKDQLDWASGYSWVTGLEKGVPGLGKYVNAPFGAMGVDQSRSEFGLQKKTGGSSSSRPIDWIRPFLTEWRKKFEDIGYSVEKTVNKV